MQNVFFWLSFECLFISPFQIYLFFDALYPKKVISGEN